MVVGSELDPSFSVTGGWEIGCSLAADGPIVLAFVWMSPRGPSTRSGGSLRLAVPVFVLEGSKVRQKFGENLALRGGLVLKNCRILVQTV